MSGSVPKPLTRDEIINLFLPSSMFKQWHWYQYHFEFYRHGEEHPFAGSIVDTLTTCESAMPGYARKFVNDLASIGGIEKHRPHYEQLLQKLAELLVISQVVSFDWPSPVRFIYEPRATGSKKNPELGIEYPGGLVLLEVKAPSLLEYQKLRAQGDVRLPSRSPIGPLLSKDPTFGTIVLPRDNPVKDFLISANSKFEPFKKQYNKCYTVLVIVWDDHIVEPISSLLGPSSGLFTIKSFAKDSAGNALTFPFVDGVVLIRHQHQIIEGAAERPLIDYCSHVMDYGKPDQFPFKVFVQNSVADTIPQEILDSLQAFPPDPMMGGEYIPSDIIFVPSANKYGRKGCLLAPLDYVIRSVQDAFKKATGGSK